MFAGCCLKFEKGIVYQYSYSTSTIFNELNTEQKHGATNKDVGVQLHINFDLIPLLTSSNVQFFKIQVCIN